MGYNHTSGKRSLSSFVADLLYKVRDELEKFLIKELRKTNDLLNIDHNNDIKIA